MNAYVTSSVLTAGTNWMTWGLTGLVDLLRALKRLGIPDKNLVLGIPPRMLFVFSLSPLFASGSPIIAMRCFLRLSGPAREREKVDKTEIH